MTDDLELARRAVACDGWRWMTGVQALWLPNPYLPDLTDPATLGCVLALVREAWGDQYIYCASSLNIHRQRWYRVVMDGDIIGSGRTERGALVEALEAAPVGGAS